MNVQAHCSISMVRTRWMMSNLQLRTGEGWPSGKMSDCNAKGREFKSRSGQNKFTKSDGQ